MGEVYRVRTADSFGAPTEYAVKRILPKHSGDAACIQQFEFEAKLMFLLVHPNIVRVHDFLNTSSGHLMVMEFVNGKDLADLLHFAQEKNAPLPLSLCLYITIEVCKGLDYAHKKTDPNTGEPLSIIHRDVSPPNIMVSRAAEIKLTDFGIAKAGIQPQLTQEGIVKGKVMYMSPEQVRGQVLDRRTDVFSATLVLLEMITGKNPFQSDSWFQTLERVRDCRILISTSQLRIVSPRLEGILLTGLAKDRANRFQEVAELREELERLLISTDPDYNQGVATQQLHSLFTPEEATSDGWDQSQLAPLSAEEEASLFEEIQRLERRFEATHESPQPTGIIKDATPEKSATQNSQNLLEDEEPEEESGLSKWISTFGALFAFVLAILVFHRAKFSERPDPSSDEQRVTKSAARKDRSTKPSLTTYERALQAYKQGKMRESLEGFHHSRTTNPFFVSAWFYEIRVLRKLHRTQEASEVAAELVKLFPSLQDHPLLKEPSSEKSS